MRILGVLVLFCLLVCKVHSKSVTLNAALGGTYLWNSSLLWVGGILPDNGDDVQIVSSALTGALTIQIPTPVNVNSLSISTSLQTTLQFSSISITSNFSCVGTAFVGGTLFFATAQSKAILSNAASFSLSFVNTTITNYGTVNYQAPTSSVQASVFWNYNTWNFVQNLTVSQSGPSAGVYGQGNSETPIDASTANFNGISTFINFGTLNLNSGYMTFYLNFNNSGTINAVGATVYIADQKTSTIHSHNGTLHLDQASSWHYDSRTYVWCSANAQHTGAGELVFAGSDQVDLVTAIFAGVDGACHANITRFEGYVSTAGSATFYVSDFRWHGGAIATPFVATSASVAAPSDPTFPSTFALSSSFTATNSLVFDTGANYFLNFNDPTASIIIPITAAFTANSGNIGNPDMVQGTIVNNGLIVTGASTYNTGAQFFVYVKNNGTIHGTTSSTAAFFGGVLNFGAITSDWNATDETDFNVYEFGFGGSTANGNPVVLMPGSQINGGYVTIFGDSLCYTTENATCTEGNSVFVNTPLHIPNFRLSGKGILNVNGTSVTIAQAYLESGSITGTGSISFGSITMPSTEETGSVTFDGINVYLNGTMYTGATTLALANGGKFTISPNAQLYVNQSVYQFSFDSDGSAVSVDNQGYIQLQTSGSDYNVYVHVPISNEGTIEIKNVNSFFQPGGQVTFASTYTASASGKLVMNVFSNVSGDYVYYYPGSAPCTIGGQLQIQFHYTPTTGDYYTFFQYQNGVNTSQCSGTFTVTATGLASGQVAKVFYGIQTIFPEDSVAVVVVCASSDSNCSAPQSAGGVIPNTTTTTTTTGSTSGPTSSTTSSPTSSSTTVLSTTGGATITYYVTVQVPGTCNMFFNTFNATYFFTLGITETGCNDTTTKRAAVAQVGLQVKASSSASTDQVKQSVVQALASGGIQGATVSSIQAAGNPNNNSAGSLKITFVGVIASILASLFWTHGKLEILET